MIYCGKYCRGEIPCDEYFKKVKRRVIIKNNETEKHKNFKLVPILNTKTFTKQNPLVVLYDLKNLLINEKILIDEEQVSMETLLYHYYKVELETSTEVEQSTIIEKKKSNGIQHLFEVVPNEKVKRSRVSEGPNSFLVREEECKSLAHITGTKTSPTKVNAKEDVPSELYCEGPDKSTKQFIEKKKNHSGENLSEIVKRIKRKRAGQDPTSSLVHEEESKPNKARIRKRPTKVNVKEAATAEGPLKNEACRGSITIEFKIPRRIRRTSKRIRSNNQASPASSSCFSFTNVAVSTPTSSRSSRRRTLYSPSFNLSDQCVTLFETEKKI